MDDKRPVRLTLALCPPSVVRALFIIVAVPAAASLAGQVVFIKGLFTLFD